MSELLLLWKRYWVSGCLGSKHKMLGKMGKWLLLWKMYWVSGCLGSKHKIQGKMRSECWYWRRVRLRSLSSQADVPTSARIASECSFVPTQSCRSTSGSMRGWSPSSARSAPMPAAPRTTCRHTCSGTRPTRWVLVCRCVCVGPICLPYSSSVFWFGLRQVQLCYGLVLSHGFTALCFPVPSLLGRLTAGVLFFLCVCCSHLPARSVGRPTSPRQLCDGMSAHTRLEISSSVTSE